LTTPLRATTNGAAMTKTNLDRARMKLTPLLLLASLGASPAVAQAPAGTVPARPAEAPPTTSPADPPTPAAPGAADPTPTPTPAAPSAAGPVPAPPAALAPSAAAGPVGPNDEVDLAPPAASEAGEPYLEQGTELDHLHAHGETAGTTIGGHAELHYSLDSVTGPGETAAEADLHRLELFLAHELDERLRFYTEIEVEHAIASSEASGEVAIEQAYVDYLLCEQALGLRAGLVLVPMGIINQWHDPPMFHGVERPQVDHVIIPSTWSEAGVGVFGEPVDGFRYQLYVVSGLDASGFSADQGVRGGRGGAAAARTDGLAITGRVEVEPARGVVAGLAAYLGEAGPNADFVDASGAEVELDVPVYGVALDARARHAGLEARAVLAWFAIGDTAELGRVAAEGAPLGLNVGSELYGLYGELAYDVLHAGLDTPHQLLPFVRVERYDTFAQAAGRDVIRAEEGYGVTEVIAGLTYRPLRQVAFKTDFLWRSPDGPLPAQGRFELGVGVMF
jgi:hypothetical protein